MMTTHQTKSLKKYIIMYVIIIIWYVVGPPLPISLWVKLIEAGDSNGADGGYR